MGTGVSISAFGEGSGGGEPATYIQKGSSKDDCAWDDDEGEREVVAKTEKLFGIVRSRMGIAGADPEAMVGVSGW